MNVQMAVLVWLSEISTAPHPLLFMARHNIKIHQNWRIAL